MATIMNPMTMGSGGQSLESTWAMNQNNHRTAQTVRDPFKMGPTLSPMTQWGYENAVPAYLGSQTQRYLGDLQQNRFNTVLPWLQGQMGDLKSQFATAGGDSGQGPEITVGPVWNQQQTQQQVNAQRALNDQSTQTQQRLARQRAAGAQVGARSPLAEALVNQIGVQGMANNANTEREMRSGMASQNAQQLLSSQQARSNAFAQRQQEDIARRAPIWNSYNALLSSLAGIV